MSETTSSTQPPFAPVILLIEDDDLLRSLVRRVLEHQGWNVLEAADGATALKLAAPPARIDILVADLTQPGLSGPKLFDQIVALHPSLSALYYSSLARYSGRALGPNEVFLQKPFGMTEMLQALSPLLPKGGYSSQTSLQDKPLAPDRMCHLMKVYQDGSDLASTVASFLSEGLRKSESVFVIATSNHCSDITHALDQRGVPVSTLTTSGQLQFVDALETLGRLQLEERINRISFEGLLDELTLPLRRNGKTTPIRVYGEIVDLLWQRGRLDAALALEGLWNDYLTRSKNRLLCGYSHTLMTSEDASAFTKVEQIHSHTIL